MHTIHITERDKNEQDLGAWQTERKTVTNTIFSHPQPARSTIFPKLCTVIELVEAIKIGVIHFLIERIVFPTGCTEKFRLINDAQFLQQALTP